MPFNVSHGSIMSAILEWLLVLPRPAKPGFVSRRSQSADDGELFQAQLLPAWRLTDWITDYAALVRAAGLGSMIQASGAPSWRTAWCDLQRPSLREKSDASGDSMVGAQGIEPWTSPV
jgi:hypothetical protein